MATVGPNKRSNSTVKKNVSGVPETQVKPNLYALTHNVTNNSIFKRMPRTTLGQGSFGKVVKESINYGKGLVATKYFLSAENFGESVNEIAIFKYLKSQPNVSQYVGIANTNTFKRDLDFPAILMGLGDPLLKLVSNTSKYIKSDYKSWPQIYNTIIGILCGYNTLHSTNIVHRDTKPENMLLSRTGAVWITDFGAARYISETIPVPTDNYTGSIWWTAPELLMKHVLGKRDHSYLTWRAADAWAVGMSLIDFLTNERVSPYQSYNENDYLAEFNIFFRELNKNSPTSAPDAKQQFNRRRVVLRKIFSLKGLPTNADGETYDLYTNTEIKKYFMNENTPEPGDLNSPIEFITENLNPKIDPTNEEFIRVCSVIEGLLTYNPENRMTIAEALATLRITPPLVKPIPTLYPQYTPPNPVINAGIKQMFIWLKRLSFFPPYSNLGESRYTVLDRAYTFLIPIINREITDLRESLLLALPAYHIAVALVEKDRKVKVAEIQAVCERSLTAYAAKMENTALPTTCDTKEINSVIKLILKSQQLLGKTHLDTMCEQAVIYLSSRPVEGLDPDEELLSRKNDVILIIQYLGFLNMIAFHNMLYQRYDEKIDKFKDTLIDLSIEMLDDLSSAALWTDNSEMVRNSEKFLEKIREKMGDRNGGAKRKTRKNYS